ncbi:MAG: NAD-binding protein [Bacteroidetes bacterium]|nr:NAD-binding protein [Bacteroidota bacterium]
MKNNSTIGSSFWHYLLLPTCLIIIFLGTWGVYEVNGNHIWNALYSAIQMFTNETNDFNVHEWKILIARFIAALLFGIVVIYGIMHVMQKDWREKIKVRFKKDHVLILGLGKIGFLLGSELARSKNKLIIIDSNEANDNISELRKLKAFIILQDIFKNRGLLNRVAKNAKKIIVSTGDDEKNIEIVNFLSRVPFVKSIDCFVHIDKPTNSIVFKDHLKPVGLENNLNISVFSITQSTGQYIFDTYRPDHGLETYDRDFSIVVIGFTQTTEHFILENFILSQFPGIKLTIYLVNPNPDEIETLLDFKYPYLSKFLNIIHLRLEDQTFYNNPFLVFDPGKLEKINLLKTARILSFYIFNDDDGTVMNYAVSVKQLLYSEFGDNRSIPVIACLTENSSIYNLVANNYGLQKNNDKIDSLKQHLEEEFNIKIVHTFSDVCTIPRFIEENEIIDLMARIINYFYFVSYALGNILFEELNLLIEKELKVSETEKITAPLYQLINGKMEFWEKDPQNGVTDFPSALNKFILEIINNLVKNFPDIKVLSDSNENPLNQIEKRIFVDLAEQLKINETDLHDLLYMKISIEMRWHCLSDRLKDSNRYAARHHEIKNKAYQQNKNIPAISYIEHNRWFAEKMVFNYRYGEYPGIPVETLMSGDKEKINIAMAENKERNNLLKDELKIHDLLIDSSLLKTEDKKKDYDLFLLIDLLEQVKNFPKQSL